MQTEALTKRILAQIVTLIEERNYLPGERLPSERELSERFGVGRGVIREVLSILENLRYLQRRPNSGIYLTPTPERISLEALSLFSHLGIGLSADKVSQAIEVRRLIEVQAVGLACQRRTDDDLDALAGVVDQFDHAIRHNPGEVATLDYEFHMALFKATKNVVLTQLVNPFYVMSADRRKTIFADPERGRISNEQHRQILQCVYRQDTANAQALMTQHIGRVESLAYVYGIDTTAVPSRS
ncbi:MAG: FadR/GntR family transcriptional regulator [Burkholderiaceae bacterium]